MFGCNLVVSFFSSCSQPPNLIPATSGKREGEEIAVLAPQKGGGRPVQVRESLTPAPPRSYCRLRCRPYCTLAVIGCVRDERWRWDRSRS